MANKNTSISKPTAESIAEQARNWTGFDKNHSAIILLRNSQTGYTHNAIVCRDRATLQELTEDIPDDPTASQGLSTFDFSSAVQWLKALGCVRRTSWPEGTFVVKQVPADISSEIIPKMTSLPDSVKNLLLGRSADAAIHYRNQMVQIDRNGIANAWQPNAEDVFADDWQIVTM